MKFAIVSYNLEDFKANQEIIFSTSIIWSDGQKTVRIFDDINYDGLILYVDNYITWSDYQYYLRSEKNNYII